MVGGQIKTFIIQHILEEHREIQEHISITTQSQPVIDALNETERNITIQVTSPKQTVV